MVHRVGRALRLAETLDFLEGFIEDRASLVDLLGVQSDRVSLNATFFTRGIGDGLGGEF